MKSVTMFVWNNFVNDARVLREAKALEELNYSVTIIAKKELTEMELKKSEKISNNIVVNRPLKWELPERLRNKFKTTILNKHLPNALLMLKMIMLGRSYNTDVYHAHDLNTLIQGIVSSKLRLKKKLLIYDSHEVQTSRTHYNFNTIYRIEKFLLKFVDEVIVENETRADYHYNLYKKYPTVIHNYSELYDIDQYKTMDLRHTYQIANDKKIVLYQGGMQEGRGLFKLLEAFKNIEGASLFMIGDGKERQNLIAKHHDLRLEDKVHFIDRVPYQLLRQYTKAADLGIQFLENTNFNHYSASSNKLFEYLMAHVPVIGSRLPEIEKIIDGEAVGLTVEEGNTKQLQEAIERMLADDDLLMNFKAHTKTAKLKYNWEVDKVVLQDLYKKINF